MFGNLMGDMEARKEEMRKKLAEISLTETTGAVSITSNANGVITNISIDKSKLDSDDMEELEDLLLIAINNVLDKAADKEAAEAQNLISSMMPPGMGNLFG